MFLWVRLLLHEPLWSFAGTSFQLVSIAPKPSNTSEVWPRSCSVLSSSAFHAPYHSLCPKRQMFESNGLMPPSLDRNNALLGLLASIAWGPGGIPLACWSYMQLQVEIVVKGMHSFIHLLTHSLDKYLLRYTLYQVLFQALAIPRWIRKNGPWPPGTYALMGVKRNNHRNKDTRQFQEAVSAKKKN